MDLNVCIILWVNTQDYIYFVIQIILASAIKSFFCLTHFLE